MTRTADGPRVVLVHGAWHGGWVWDRVMARLRAAGVAVDAVDLPGIGRAAGRDDLSGHVDALRRHLTSVAGPVVLCGHSYGGAVITAAATDDVVELVYLAAFALAPGESCADQNHPSSPAAEPPVLRGHHLHVLPASARRRFYGGCTEADADAAVARLTPEHRDTVTAPVPRAAWQHIPSTYVVCQDDVALPAAAQRRMATRAGRIVEIEAGHSPMLSRPDEVTDVLLTVRDEHAAPSPRPAVLE